MGHFMYFLNAQINLRSIQGSTGSTVAKPDENKNIRMAVVREEADSMLILYKITEGESSTPVKSRLTSIVVQNRIEAPLETELTSLQQISLV